MSQMIRVVVIVAPLTQILEGRLRLARTAEVLLVSKQ